MSWRAWLGCAAAFPAGLGAPPVLATAPSPTEPVSASAVVQELREFRELGSVLYIAAHPDDENSRLLAYLAQGRACRTAYLSLTRGDGGQNLIGPELGDELGVIRTQELLGARRIDGARQFFSRARDFGFSKDYRQTLAIWDKQKVLADVVRAIRSFRPDVIITRFAPWPTGTHGQHTASAVLALEAFKLAGDPKAFPDQLGELEPWQPRRIFWNSTPFRAAGGAPVSPVPGVLRLDFRGYQAVLGQWFGVTSARSRSMQRTQGMGSAGTRGNWYETFQLLAGQTAARDLFDGIDTKWSRFPGGAEIGSQADDALARFNPQNPAASVPALLALRAGLRAMAAHPGAGRGNPVIDDKIELLDRLLQACLGLHVETVVAESEMAPGEILNLSCKVIVGSEFPVRWLEFLHPGPTGSQTASDLPPGREVSREASLRLSPELPVSQPFWLREEGSKGMFGLADSPFAIRPDDPPVVEVSEVFEVGGQELTIRDEPVEVIGDPAKGEIRRRLQIIPPVSIDFSEEVELFAPGAARPVVAELTAARAGVAGMLRVEAPTGWQVAPEGRSFHLGFPGERARFSFTVTAPARSATAELRASAEVGGVRYGNRRVRIGYEHIPALLYQPPARLKAVSLELAIRGRRVGYVPGAGDRVAESLEQMGYEVVRLTEADLTPEGLRGLDAVVFGVRAFNVGSDLAPRLPALWSYIASGGNVIVQYNTNFRLKTSSIAPYDLKLSDGRITDETAAVRLLAPDHPALTTPNRIGPADFDGWVQERARYLPSEWDGRFTPLLASGDPGELPNDASLLVARYGRGYYVYSGLSWFRELPAGVPGAYRLFANLVSLGK